MVHAQLKKYLTEREESIKSQAEEWQRKSDDNRQRIEDQIEELKKEKQEKMEKLEIMRRENEAEEAAQRERERKELEEADKK